MEMSAGRLWGLRRLSDEGGRFQMLAVDQRPPIKNLVAARRGVEVASYDDVCTVKALLVEELAPLCSAVLVDPHYAYPAAVHLASPARGLLVTLEDSVFTDTPGGRRSSSIDHWSVAKIGRIGADAVKLLAWYRPDADPAVLDHQQAFVAEVGEACRRHDLPFVLELLVYPLSRPGEAGGDDLGVTERRAELVLDSVATFADPGYGVDLFKLESPWPAAEVPDPDGADAERVQGWFDELGKRAGRPWVMLSAGAGPDEFRRILVFAYRAGASGYLAGRAIWWEAFQRFPDLEAMRAELQVGARRYVADINQLTARSARPWWAHPVYGPEGPVLAGAGPDWRVGYGEPA